ncbi:DUF853 family protein [Myxococcota bacterium]|nr:DUF853 family protein [Myxococcota bacterium]
MNDRRVELFCSDQMPDLFHPIAHSNDVFRPDPLDVREVHLEAREHFERLVEGATSEGAGRILLIKGESGSGKTHLMRAFRNHVHDFQLGFFAYLQMTTQAVRYDRYILHKVIDSLDRPYCPPAREASSLQILSDALARLLPAAKVDALRELDSGQDAGPLIDELTDALVDRLGLPDVSPDVLRVLLYLQLDKPNIQQKVRKYLRAEALSVYERTVLGGIAPRNVEDDALELVEQLIRVVRRVLERSFVLCVDQLEDMSNQEDSAARARRAMDAVKQLGAIPGTVVVVACHHIFYEELRQKLADSVVSRLEQPPGPVQLRAGRDLAEAEAILGRRLRHLYDSLGGAWRESEPTAPLSPEVIAGFDKTSTRALLIDAGRYRERARVHKGLPVGAKGAPIGAPPPEVPAGHAAPSPEVPTSVALVQAWNDFTAQAHLVPEEDTERAALLARAIEACGTELGAPAAFHVTATGDDHRVEHRFDTNLKNLRVSLCEKSARGGGLANQIDGLTARAGKERPVIVRSTDFPKGPTTQVGKLIGKVIAKGGRRAVIEDAEWRTMVALEAFRGRHAGPAFEEFLQSERPLTRLLGLRLVLDLDELEPSLPRVQPEPARPDTAAELLKRAGLGGPTVGPDAQPVRPDSTKGARIDGAPAAPIIAGRLLSRTPKDITLDPESLKRHAAFLGGTGSGKTTAALAIIEQLLARGVPALLLDRKGDLAGYRIQGLWGRPTGDAERDRLRQRLMETVDVAVYTPGHPGGRALSLSILPSGLHELPAFEQEQAARVSALALADMMNYGVGQKAQGKQAALQVALQYLAREPSPPTLRNLVELVTDKDPSIMGELGALAKFLDELGLDLKILEQQKKSLLEVGEERLDAATLFGRAPGSPKGRTRLTILSTKFLMNRQDELFWVAQLLMEVYRWVSRNPSSELQAALLLDEADIYLPATRQPATKQPVEDLLRRARAMGLAVFLATQNPGDLDYRCRDNILTWYVGKLSQKTGIEKIEDLFGATPASVADLSTQTTGQFHVLSDKTVSRIHARRNVVELPTSVPEDQILRLAAAGAASAADLA